MAAAPAERRAAAQQRGMTADIVLEAPLAGCYDANESTDILPKRFALAADGEVRYVDSTGVVDGKIADATWMEVNGRAVIRTVTRGQVLTVWRQGSVLRANSPLGNRSVRILACR